MDDLSESKLFGSVVMTLLFLGAVCVASLPLLAGVIIGAYMPGTGGIRNDLGLRGMLHFLWIYPAVFVFATVLGGLNRYLELERGKSRRYVSILEAVLMWILVTVLFGVFFEQSLGAAVGAAAALVLYWPFVRWMEASSKDDPARGTP